RWKVSPSRSRMVQVMQSFFSSRRRHTRWPRDWSSDVCSSDLGAIAHLNALDEANSLFLFENGSGVKVSYGASSALAKQIENGAQIGRASCRERVDIALVAVA